MTAPLSPDERVMGTGTTVRFALLMVLIVAASGALMHDVLSGVSGSSGVGCLLAGGADPNADTLQVQLVLADQFPAYDRCMSRFQPSPPWWANLGWPVAVLVGAMVVFRAIPVLRSRSRRVVPLEVVDRSGAIRRAVDAAIGTAGLDRAPRVVAEPLARSAGAVVFGSNRRPVLCLPGGLLVRATTGPEHFRAVVLHELAHIRHGDITLTYATVALWRVFVGLVLLPYAVWTAVVLLGNTWWSGDQPIGVRGALLAVLMVLLVHLARLDVLRSREVHADVAAAGWGAAHGVWAAAPPEPTRGRLRRLVAAFAELWRTHPRLDLRRAALADSGSLSGVRGLPVFLTGVAATLVNAQLGTYVEAYLARDGRLRGWITQALPLVPSGLVVGAVGFALWRAVEHAVATSRPAPSGALAGLWLGSGLAFGELFLNRVAVTEWVPAHPEALVLVVAAGVGVTWWTGQCARLWATTWRGPTARPVVVAGLVAAWLALAAWSVWWRVDGVMYASGWPFGVEEVRAVLTRGFGEAASGYATTLSAFAAVFPVLHGLSTPVLLPAAVGTLWVVPLVAWAVRPPDGTPRWLRSAVDGTGAVLVGDAALPPLRRVLRPGLLGGGLACAAMVGLQAYLHTWHPLPAGEGALFALTYQSCLFVVLVAGTALAAVHAAARPGGLLVAVIAAQTAAVVGFAGMLVLTSADGCVEPLRTLESTCRPHFTTTGLAFGVMLVPLVVLAGLAAFAAAGVAEVVRRVRARGPTPPPGWNPRGLPRRRGAVAVLCVAAVAIGAAGVVLWNRNDGGGADAAPLFAIAAKRPLPARTRAAQAYAWLRYGGEDLNRRIADTGGRHLAVLHRITSGDHDVSSLLPTCAEFGRIAADATSYFRVPDPPAQERWAAFLDLAGRGSENCATALDRGSQRLLLQSLDQLAGALQAATAAARRLTEVTGG
ncbi:M48 family metalloprotease [Actinosynnema sp. NPDC051121]